MEMTLAEDDAFDARRRDACGFAFAAVPLARTLAGHRSPLAYSRLDARPSAGLLTACSAVSPPPPHAAGPPPPAAATTAAPPSPRRRPGTVAPAAAPSPPRRPCPGAAAPAPAGTTPPHGPAAP